MPALPVPALPVPAHPVPAQPLPTQPMPTQAVPAQPVSAQPEPAPRPPTALPLPGPESRFGNAARHSRYETFFFGARPLALLQLPDPGRQRLNLLRHAPEHLLQRIGQIGVIQVDDVHFAAVQAHDPSGHAHHRRVGRHLRKHHRAGADLGIVADPNEPSTLAPVAITTLLPMVGWRLPFSLPVPPSTTP